MRNRPDQHLVVAHVEDNRPLRHAHLRLRHEMVERDPTEEEIRLLAYSKWEKAGRPPGDGSDFWAEAESELK